jgi:hypothetical protein
MKTGQVDKSRSAFWTVDAKAQGLGGRAGLGRRFGVGIHFSRCRAAGRDQALNPLADFGRGSAGRFWGPQVRFRALFTNSAKCAEKSV